MNDPYSPKPPKRLERSRTDKILGGVCGGTAKYLNMDPTLVRVLTAILTVFTGIPIVVYIVMLIVVPEEGSQPTSPGYPPVQPPPAGRPDSVWGPEGAPWEQRRPEPVVPSDPPPAEPTPRSADRPQDPPVS